MVKCPYCGNQKLAKRLVSREWEEEKYEVETCPLCEGKGEISEMQAATFKARGNKLPPVPLRGYA